MEKFVFRNNTIESFFGKEYRFSGYDDISYVPQDVDFYVWWYQAPIKTDARVVSEEIHNYTQELSYVLSMIGEGKLFIALTMEVLYSVPLTDDNHMLRTAVNEYNNVLYSIASQKNNVKVVDVSEFTCRYSTIDLLDWKFYFISQMGMNPKLHKDFKAWWEKKLNSISLKRKKCLVLDLDNTLWGGVLGEDGVDGIKIGGEYPGKAFLYWQEALLDLSKTGVILSVCSKNNEDDVLNAWNNNPNMVLKKNDFAAYRINWIDKASNIRSLADELNIGLDSIVFLDDSSTERELIRQMLPMVTVPDFPEHPYELMRFFEQLVIDYFKVYSVTTEDIRKTEQYKQNAQRAQAQSLYDNFDSFLRSLDIHICVESANTFNINRIAQMTQKTNQFNLTTHRYTDADIRLLIEKGCRVWCLSTSDRFGDSGITGAIIVKPDGSIDTFLLSCRILGKGIEIAFAKSVFKMLIAEGIEKLTACYIPTAKNAQVKEFWDKLGFNCVSESNNGRKDYELVLSRANISIAEYYTLIIK